MSSKERSKKAEREVARLRTLASRQRRNIKNLVAVILNARKALEQEDNLRLLALLSGNVKYPPAVAKGVEECPQHGDKCIWVQVCDICGEGVE